MYLPYSPGERAAWAMKPFWGLHENLLPETDLLEGSLEAVILLVAHAFRLGLTLSVAALYPLEEFLTFAEAQPIFTQTLLDQQFNFDNFLLNISMVIPRLIRDRLVWPRLRHTLLQAAGLRDAGRSAVSVLMKHTCGKTSGWFTSGECLLAGNLRLLTTRPQKLRAGSWSSFSFMGAKGRCTATTWNLKKYGTEGEWVIIQKCASENHVQQRGINSRVCAPFHTLRWAFQKHRKVK